MVLPFLRDYGRDCSSGRAVYTLQGPQLFFQMPKDYAFHSYSGRRYCGTSGQSREDTERKPAGSAQGVTSASPLAPTFKLGGKDRAMATFVGPKFDELWN